ncbi:MAG TPA: DUF6209 family protein [Myxococcus sp.]|nr:DUF6209 family protein [Myxococcus sp.]
MSTRRIDRPTVVPTQRSTTGTADRATRATPDAAPAPQARKDGFDSGAARPAPAVTLGGSASVAAPESTSKAGGSLAASMQPQVHAATGYGAHFGSNSRTATAVVDGQGRVTLPTGNGRGPSFTAEAGKPFSVTVDPSRVSSSAQKVELVWRQVPGGTEQAIPLTDGSKDPKTGKLNTLPAKLDVPPDATGLLRLSIRTTSADGKVSNHWDPSSDAAIASREGATVAFTDDWKVQTEGAVRAGDRLTLAYDRDRVSAMFGGKVPSDVVACVSFDGEPPLEVPLTVKPDGAGGQGTMFMPSLRVPFEATKVSIWFKGQADGQTAWDSAFGKNYSFNVGTARDDADPSWKAELLRSKSFPNLQEGDFVGIGPSSQRYNCIAWTLGIRDQWVWPGTRVEDFDKLYGKEGYKPLKDLDLSHDPNVEKIVVYGLKPKTGTGPIEVTHGARMDEQGRLTSKIGTQPLIRHNSADDLTGPSYGEPVRVYVRPRQVPVNPS